MYVRTVVAFFNSVFGAVGCDSSMVGRCGRTTARTFRLQQMGDDAGRAAHRSLTDRLAYNERLGYRYFMTWVKTSGGHLGTVYPRHGSVSVRGIPFSRNI
ncbi:hypothetical protein GCM10020219_038290 [Nonomuraea dietziae]